MRHQHCEMMQIKDIFYMKRAGVRLKGQAKGKKNKFSNV